MRPYPSAGRVGAGLSSMSEWQIRRIRQPDVCSERGGGVWGAKRLAVVGKARNAGEEEREGIFACMAEVAKLSKY